METTDHPGVYFPPPLVFLLLYLLSVLLQKELPLDTSFFKVRAVHILGWILSVGSFAVGIPAVLKFHRTNNTVVTIHPATSLQTQGIFSLTRNPMYLSAVIFYSGLGFLVGNWWTFILLPAVVLIIRFFVIRKEENYLERAFGQNYLDYKKSVRRWI